MHPATLAAATRGTSRVRIKRFADIAVTDQNDKRSLIDTKVTRATSNAEPMHAASAGEKQKIASYEKFMRICREEDPTDERLYQTITPVVFETYGAAGKMTQTPMDLARHQFSSNILQCEDKSAEQIFYSTWAQRISTALQVGNAVMIYNIPRGISVKSRLTGDTVTPELATDSTKHRTRNKRPQPRGEHDLDSESESGTEAESEPEPESEPEE